MTKRSRSPAAPFCVPGKAGAAGALHQLSAASACPDLAFLLDHRVAFRYIWSILGWNIHVYHSHVDVHPQIRERQPDWWHWHQDGGPSSRSPRPGRGLLIIADPERVVAVLALVVVSTALEVAALTRWPGVVRRTAAVLILDTALLGAIVAPNTGSAAFFLFTVGAAALAGVLLGMRAWPLWVLHAAIGFVAAAKVLRADGVMPEVSAFVVAFPMTTVVTGLVAASITAATVRHVDLLVEVVAGRTSWTAVLDAVRWVRTMMLPR
jgi:hypothetical protein